jgi:hypothetical protein
MKAQRLNKFVIISDEAKQAFVDVACEVFVKLNESMDEMKKAKVLPSDAKEIFEYGLRAGQYMTLIEISTGLQLDAKEDGEGIVNKAPIEVVKKQFEEKFVCPDSKSKKIKYYVE